MYAIFQNKYKYDTQILVAKIIKSIAESKQKKTKVLTIKFST